MAHLHSKANGEVGSHHTHSHAHGHDHSHGHNDDPDIAEEAHFLNIINTFNAYQAYCLSANQVRRKHFYSLSGSQRALLPDYAKRLNDVDEAIQHNASVLQAIIADADMFGIDIPDKEHMPLRRATDHDMDKLRSTIKQFVRDWSQEGEPERIATYRPIVEEIEAHYAKVERRGDVHILVPGAGLGRLAFDIAKSGFSCQGNEFSFYMLLCSNFILNRASSTDQFKLYPFVHSFSNVRSRETLLRSVSIPDVLPRNLPPDTDFSMVAGDFLEVYGAGSETEGKWDAVVTCFFIDTAKNILDYIQVIWDALKPGGIWINLGE